MPLRSEMAQPQGAYPLRTNQATDDDDNSADYQRFQWRNELTAPVTITLGKTPTITLAFDPDGTIGFAGNIALSAHCENNANTTTGIYISNPKVTITIAN